MAKFISIILISLSIAVAIYCSVDLHATSRVSAELKQDLAEINRVKYGILSVTEWKDRLATILAKKIDEFEITDDNRAQLQANLEKGLHTLLDEVKQAMNRNKNDGNFIDWIKGETVDLFFDIEDLRKDIPKFASAILVELDKPETRKNLKKYIKEKLDEFVDKTVGHEDRSLRKALISKHQGSSPAEASQHIYEQLDPILDRQWLVSLLLIACIVLAFVFYWLPRSYDSFSFCLLIVACAIPLYAGISTPMIDIDARIDTFRFQLMGEPLEFDDQVLYFQSKSILDVVTILIKKGGIDTAVVGVLVMLFSVIFPLLKLVSTLFVEFKRSLMGNKIISFFVTRSAKWSMADVLVVAIFMSFIGFKGVIDAQLGQMERSEGNLDILTTDMTSLQVGFSLFLCFVLAGMVLGAIASGRFKSGIEVSVS